jgi:hypothetical protein
VGLQRRIRRGRNQAVVRFEWMVCWLAGGRYRQRKFGLVQHSQAWLWFHSLCDVSDAVTIYQRSGDDWKVKGFQTAP